MGTDVKGNVALSVTATFPPPLAGEVARDPSAEARSAKAEARRKGQVRMQVRQTGDDSAGEAGH